MEAHFTSSTRFIQKHKHGNQHGDQRRNIPFNIFKFLLQKKEK